MNAMYSDTENKPPEKADTNQDVIKPRKSLTKSHLSQDNNFLDLELSVSEKPEDPLDNRILQNRANLPPNIRQTQNWKNSQSFCHELQDRNQNWENIQEFKTTEAILPVLSVKTLADMFDYCLVDNINHIKENKIKIVTENITEC